MPNDKTPTPEILEAGAACSLGAAGGVIVANTVGGMGLAVGGGAIAIGAPPVIALGGIVGLAGWAVAHLFLGGRPQYGMYGFYEAIRYANPNQLSELARLLNSPSSQPEHIWHHVAHLRSPHQGWKQTVTDVADRTGLDWDQLLNGRQWADISVLEIEKAVTHHLFGEIDEMPSHHVSTPMVDSLPLKWRQLALAIVGVSLVR
ncbi:MAG: hypothetical protein AAGF93_00315 [Cyanobacteria bacterium P01_H01_bin.105]